jgi:pyruvate formate lyase activating enzyme
VNDPEGLIFDIDTFAVHDGPGIRMAVYLKGCPLSCAWCHSPESIAPHPQLILLPDRCARCGACAAACAQGAHVLEEGAHRIDREACRACGACVAHCVRGALAIKGQRVAASAIVQKAARLKPFFDHSGGGITLTGGEVTMQWRFAQAVLAGCKEAGIHTAIETCGACRWDALAHLLPYTDLVLYDLKLMDEGAHRRWTRASNRAVLRNAARLAGAMEDGAAVQVRLPMIPGITDTEPNLRALFAFMRQVGLLSVALLPYNNSAAAKYEWLGLAYPLAHAEREEGVSPEQAAAMAREAGVEVT